MVNKNVKYHPLQHKSSIKWLEKILSERFNYDWILSYKSKKLQLRVNGHEGVIFFDLLNTSFFSPDSNLCCSLWDAQLEGWHSALGTQIPAPGANTLPIPLIEHQSEGYLIHYDIFSFIYWMLSRQEEADYSGELDNHDRFPATASHAYKNNYLNRPVVDEWLYILEQVILRTWPQLKLKPKEFNIKLSHDVDNPSRYGLCSIKQLIRTVVGGEIIKRKNVMGALKAPWIHYATQKNLHLHVHDPNNTFDWIMDVSEQHGLNSAFYFICGGKAPQDANYYPEHPAIRELMRNIHKRGHEIGLHPSYNSYLSHEIITAEAQRLRKICSEEGIKQSDWGGRMHFLRWEHPSTLYSWEKANMNYDSTLGYADMPGFRCGTCFEYPAFDPVKKQIINLRIRPLITMECTIIADRYMGLGYTEKALNTFLYFKETCRKVNGTYTLLWHNSYFTTAEDKFMYKEILV